LPAVQAGHRLAPDSLSRVNRRRRRLRFLPVYLRVSRDALPSEELPSMSAVPCLHGRSTPCRYLPTFAPKPSRASLRFRLRRCAALPVARDFVAVLPLSRAASRAVGPLPHHRGALTPGRRSRSLSGSQITPGLPVGTLSRPLASSEAVRSTSRVYSFIESVMDAAVASLRPSCPFHGLLPSHLNRYSHPTGGGARAPGERGFRSRSFAPAVWFGRGDLGSAPDFTPEGEPHGSLRFVSDAHAPLAGYLLVGDFRG